MHWRSKLIHPGAHAPANFRSLATPTYRGSTVVFERQADVSDDWRQTENGYTYGLYGTPTVLELGAPPKDSLAAECTRHRVRDGLTMFGIKQVQHGPAENLIRMRSAE